MHAHMSYRGYPEQSDGITLRLNQSLLRLITTRPRSVRIKRLLNMSRQIEIPAYSRPMYPIQPNESQVHQVTTFALAA